jgi:hypothetical protein
LASVVIGHHFEVAVLRRRGGVFMSRQSLFPFGFALSAFITACSGVSVRSQPVTPGEAQPSGGEIHGTVLTKIGQNDWIPLSAFPVSLEDKIGNIVDETLTDAHGRYYFGCRPKGEYRLTWAAPGWEPGKLEDLIKLGNETKHVDQIVARSIANKEVVCGKVKLSDGESPYLDAEEFDLEQTAEVEANDAAEDVLRRAQINSDGHYILPGLSSRPRTLRARLVRTGALASKGKWEASITLGERESRALAHDRLAGAVEASGSRSRYEEGEARRSAGDRLARSGEGERELRAVAGGRMARAPKAPASQSRDYGKREAETASGDIITIPDLVLPSRSLKDVTVTVTDKEGRRLEKIAAGATVIINVKKPANRTNDLDLDCLWRVNGSEVGRGERFPWTLASDMAGHQTAHYLLLERHGGFSEGSITLTALRP